MSKVFERRLHGRLKPSGRWVRLCSSTNIASPIATGLLDPMILIPERLFSDLSEEELDQVVLHELGHLRRRDDWVMLAEQVAVAIFFFHPAVRWTTRGMNIEREIACDDYVVSLTGEPRRYAACLTRLLEVVRGKTQFLPVPDVVGSGKPMTRRIERLVSGWKRASFAFSLAVFLVVFGLMGAALFRFRGVEPLVPVPGSDRAFFRLATVKEMLVRFARGDTLPSAIGLSNDVVVIGNPDALASLTGPLRDILEREVHTPQIEQLFRVSFAHAERGPLLRRRNLVLVGTGDGSGLAQHLVQFAMARLALSEAYRDRESVFVLRDIWARGQQVVVISGSTPERVRESLLMEADRIYAAVEGGVDHWLYGLLYHFGEQHEVREALAQELGWTVRVPSGFRMLDREPGKNFVVFTRQQKELSQWLFVYWEEGVLPDQLTETWCLDKRDEVARNFFDADVIERPSVRMAQREFAGKLAVRMEGLWENLKDWKGGPFRNYALVDVEQDRFFMVDMGVFAPNLDKALSLQQLEVMARTFELNPVVPEPVAEGLERDAVSSHGGLSFGR